jgi:glucose/arabinose dehydrogenase
MRRACTVRMAFLCATALVSSCMGTIGPEGDLGGTTDAGSSVGGHALDADLGMGGANGESSTVSAGGTADAGEPGGAGSAGVRGPGIPPPLGSWPPPALKLTAMAEAHQATAIAAPPGDATRLFFLEKGGIVRVIKDGSLLPTPALDINTKVLEGDPSGGAENKGAGKRGAVGLAFHPDYATNGRVFLMYVADQGEEGYGMGGPANDPRDDGDLTFEEYARGDTPDVFKPEPTRMVLQIDKGTCGGCYQHNGGSLEIGVDGFMYASTGDPPPYTDPGAADPQSLLGKMLRFDISEPDVKPAGNYPGGNPYVWDIGLRNPYKFSFDRITGTLYIGDVGEGRWEEISIKAYGEAHKNFGWPKKEGTHNYQAGACDDCVDPIAEHGHNNADNAVIGGMVYRGSKIPELQGTYLYGDHGSMNVRALQVDQGKLVNGPLVLSGLKVRSACFGQDGEGEIYVCGYTEGKIFRVDPN